MRVTWLPGETVRDVAWLPVDVELVGGMPPSPGPPGMLRPNQEQTEVRCPTQSCSVGYYRMVLAADESVLATFDREGIFLKLVWNSTFG